MADTTNRAPPITIKKPPSRCGFFQIVGSGNVHGMRIPTNKVGRTRLKKFPGTINIIPIRILMKNITFTDSSAADIIRIIATIRITSVARIIWKFGAKLQ